MKLSQICVKRPVLAWVFTLIIMSIGLLCMTRLQLQQWPTVSKPYISISTDLPGAGPDVVEAQVTRVIEDAMSNIEGVMTITSNSSSEKSEVSVEFNPERKMDEATNDVRDRLSKIKDKIAQEASEPLITKSKSDDRAVVTLALTSTEKNPTELYDLAQRDLVKDLEAMPGAARVDVMGAGDIMMKIYLKPDQMASYGISVIEVINAIKRQNFEKPAGRIVTKNKEYILTTVASLEKPEEFEQLIVSNKNDTLVRLNQIGHVELSDDNRKTKTRFNGKRCVTLGIVKQSNANPLEVSKNVEKILTKLRSVLPEDVCLDIANDYKPKFIKAALDRVFKTILEAIVLVVAVILLFLRSWKASLVPLVTIPVSLLGTFFFMYIFDFSINFLTSIALVLAIGLVVDDAIVVLEKIHRHIESGMSKIEAAILGMKEISFAIIAMTLTLAAVYAPISFAQGVIGKYLIEFSISLAVSVLISGFVALTLSPMMCSRLLNKDDHHVSKKELKVAHGWKKFFLQFKSDEWLEKLEKKYVHFLEIALKKRFLTIGCGILLSVLGGVIYQYLPSELTPKEDQGAILVEGHAPLSATLSYTEGYVEQIDTYLAKEFPDIERRVTQINNPSFDINIELKKNRKLSTDEITKKIQGFLKTITGVDAKIKMTGDEESKVVQFVVRGNKNHKEMSEIVSRLISQKLHGTKIMGPIHSATRPESADYLITILRDKVSALNLEPYTVAETIDALIRGAQARTFKREKQMYRVWVEVADVDRQSPDDVLKLFIKANDKEQTLVPLAELVNLTTRMSPVEIFRYDRMRAVSVFAYMKPGYSLGQGVKEVEKLTPELKELDVRVDFINETKRFLTEGNTIIMIFGFALLFIYLVMAAQFESWRDPFMILMTVPFALAGALLILFFIDRGSINIYSNMGLITLIGLITKHGILMVDFANELRQSQNYKIHFAIVEAAKLRLRPILMTTFAMVFGAIPMVFGTDEGAEALRQVGWVIVGGMSIGTVFTLFVLPAVYTLMSPKQMKVLEKI